MGICYSDTSSPVQSKSQNSISIRANEQLKSPQIMTEETFPDMPEYDGIKTKGYGIKEMKAYKCDLKIDELIKLREKFWESKKTNRNMWKIIHQACVYDHIKAEEFLAKNNFRTVSGCINRCVDANNNLYQVPNYCINDPYFELELLENDETKNEMINVVFFDLANGKRINLEISEGAKGKEIVEKYAKEHNIDLSKNKIRLLFGGGVIKDDETLYQHKIKNGYNVQIWVSPID